MAEPYNDVQGRSKAEGLSRGSQTRIIHSVLTDTHLKEKQRERGRENIK